MREQEHPVILMSKGRRLAPARVLALLPHDADQAEQLADLAAADTSARPVAFVYIAHADAGRKKPPEMFEIVDPYADDRTAQDVFAQAASAARKGRLDSRFVYVPAAAPAGTFEWLMADMAPQEMLMLDDGAGLAAADRFTLEHTNAGDTPVLHYRAKPV